jgi:transcriptional regulator with XRE-family HTH domain
MSPRNVTVPAPRARSTADRIAHQLGREMAERRRSKAWTLERVAARAGVTISTVHGLEAGLQGSLLTYVRVAHALGMDPAFSLSAERNARPARDSDPVHAAMGEVQAAHFRLHGREVLLDEPYQHFQFAGRADVLVLDRTRRALLHIENRTGFPDIQAFVGSYNAKRAYLAGDIAGRLAVRGGFSSIAHVVVAIWSAEVLHTIRLRLATFSAVCPDPVTAFEAWWNGATPPNGVSSALVLFDPLPGQRSTRRRWVGLDAVRRVDARYRSYAEALA